MKLNLKRQVDTRVTVVAVIIVLAIVQAVWWKGLVWRWKPPTGPPRGGGGGGGAPEMVLTGREDVYVDTLAGAPDPGDADGVGRLARFDGPVGIALDKDGGIFVADSRNHRIRRVSPNGRVETIAGSDEGFADGPAAGAKFSFPSGVTVLPNGIILVADTGNNRIRAIKDGVVTTVAGGDAGNADGDGKTARFDHPMAFSRPKGGSAVTVADALNRKLRIIPGIGPVASGPGLDGTPTSLADVSGIVVTLPDKGTVVEKGASKTVTIGSSNITLAKPLAVCASKSGYYISSAEHGALFEVQNGITEVIAGGCMANKSILGLRDGAGNRAGFGTIAGIAYDGKGHVYVSEITNNAIRRITLPEARN